MVVGSRRIKTPEAAARLRERKSERKLEAIENNNAWAKANPQEWSRQTTGKTLIERIEDELRDKLNMWITANGEWQFSPKKLGQLRGEVRGLALSLAILRWPYRDSVVMAKKIEKRMLRELRQDG